MDNIDKFQVTAEEKGFYQQTKCFNLCVKSFKESLLTSQERRCLNSCFSKLEKSQKIFIDKLKETMEYLVIMDPGLRNKFQQQQKGKSE